MSKWRVGIYLRLSSEDKSKISDESNSITNQRELIKSYISKDKSLELINVYKDDGFTGTDFDRPGFQNLYEDIINKKINCIVVKDLSRLGRNYLEVGNFIENIIPRYNLRFISINENVDSYLKPDSIKTLEIPFKNLMNESYSKDSSNKIRTSLKASKKSGNFITNIAPFGYVKNKKDIHKLDIDKEAAEIVEKVFLYALRGNSRKQIVDLLNENHIITPSNFLHIKRGVKTGAVADKWTVRMVDTILKNKTYIGYSLQNKTNRISHKNHSQVNVPEEEWIVDENHHKPIIKEEYFNQVQLLLYSGSSRANIKGDMPLFSGFLKCKECNSSLWRYNHKNRNDVEYYCSSYVKNKNCSKHYIKESLIYDIVLTSINNFIDMITDISEKIDLLYSESNNEYKKNIKQIKIVELDKDIMKYNDLLGGILEDYKKDYILKDDFEKYNREYLYELNRLRLEREKLNKNENNDIDLKWINDLKNNGKIEKLDRKIISNFINKIYVSDDGSIDIMLKYDSQYENAIKALNYAK